MSVLGGFLSAFNYFGGNEEDDSVDWLHYVITSNLLVALAGLVSVKQFGGAPIECLVPNMFSGAWEQVSSSHRHQFEGNAKFKISYVLVCRAILLVSIYILRPYG